MSIEGAPPLSAWRSGAFRFALVLALVFAAGSVALLWIVQRQVAGYGAAVAEQMLHDEASVMAGEYAQLGLPGLLNALKRHSEVSHDRQFHYLLADRQGNRLFGDITTPGPRLGKAVIMVHEQEGKVVPMRQLGLRLGDGMMLVVATDAFDVAELRERLARFTLVSGIAITLFALIGGYGAGRLFLRRLDAVNRKVEQIVAGDSGERLPTIGIAPEFDALTRNLNRMLDRKDAAMEALRQVSTAIAHDLRTPLMRLHQRLENIAIADAQNTRGIDAALGEVEGILSTFQALLRIGQIEGGVGRSRFRPVDLSGVMAGIAETWAPVAEDAGHGLEARIAPGIMAEGDEALLTQLFCNLIENAIVHTPPGTRITMDLARAGGIPVARIADNGPGVLPGEAERIFQRFFRGATSRDRPGVGLGLSLVAAIADLHGAPCRLVPGQAGFAIELTFSRQSGAP